MKLRAGESKPEDARLLSDMLFLLIPIVWLSILALLVAVCRAAAQGDAQFSAPAQRSPGSIGFKLILARASSPLPTAARRPHGRTALRHVPAASTRRRSLAAHGGR
jgi:hypothetical protein